MLEQRESNVEIENGARMRTSGEKLFGEIQKSRSRVGGNDDRRRFVTVEREECGNRYHLEKSLCVSEIGDVFTPTVGPRTIDSHLRNYYHNRRQRVFFSTHQAAGLERSGER